MTAFNESPPLNPSISAYSYTCEDHQQDDSLYGQSCSPPDIDSCDTTEAVSSGHTNTVASTLSLPVMNAEHIAGVLEDEAPLGDVLELVPLESN